MYYYYYSYYRLYYLYIIQTADIFVVAYYVDL